MDRLDKWSRILVVLLKNISIRSLFDGEIQSRHLQHNHLSGIMLPYMTNYSDTELTHILNDTESVLKGYEDIIGADTTDNLNLFQIIFAFTDKILVEQENEVLCKYGKLLRWRSLVSKISEETLVMAYMANQDVLKGVQRKSFNHKPVITHNNIQLKSILSEGMSENHFHLMGSSPYFQLSWIQLMNEITEGRIVENLRLFEKQRRNVNIKYSAAYEEESFEVKVRQAFVIRLYLFSKLGKIQLKLREYTVNVSELDFNFDKVQIAQEFNIDVENILAKWKEKSNIVDLLVDLWEQDEKWDKFVDMNSQIYCFMKNAITIKINAPKNRWSKQEITVIELIEYFLEYQDEILLEECKEFIEPILYHSVWDKCTLIFMRFLLSNSLYMELQMPEYQSLVHAIKGANRFLERDYAMLLSDYEWYDNQGNYIDLWGERVFLYRCFREISRSGYLFSEYESNLFHAYLAIKEGIRAEMVQANEYVGFENFQIHQNRKEFFLNGTNFEQRMARMAVRDTLQSQNILSLEARISPKLTAEDNYEIIEFLDNSIDETKKLSDRYYYVFHFIKTQDKEIELDVPCECRHFAKRWDNMERAFALKAFRERYPQTATRVLGIDAASQEIGCRPEVFAVIFRALKGHSVAYGVTNEKKMLPQLRLSYHVGEDFLDVVDGLRAIDEAISFLNMDCGDRLGHALALGIDVNEWYVLKREHVSLSAQDYLDNVVWLYHAMIKYEIEDKENLKSFLEAEFSDYFNKIYGGAVNQTRLNRILKNVRDKYLKGKDDPLYCFYAVEQRTLHIDINTYYKAWQLRGDAPELYKRGYYDKTMRIEVDMGKYSVNSLFPLDSTIRYIPEVAYLYYLYHYSRTVRVEGKKEVSYKITNAMHKAISAVQKKMQQEVLKRGIGIETNPTSNYMIGTFKKYAKHPLIAFYNRGLVLDEEKIKECPQIWCSINTDDQGVFCASLENEYALMARALEKEKDECGNPLYNKTMIYDWIDNIRVNGNRQSFNYLRKFDSEKGK